MMNEADAARLVREVEELTGAGEMTIVEAAKRVGTTVPTFAYWRKKLRKAKRRKGGATLVNVEVPEDDTVSIVLLRGPSATIERITGNLAGVLRG